MNYKVLVLTVANISQDAVVFSWILLNVEKQRIRSCENTEYLVAGGAAQFGVASQTPS
jgi:hypothetical protein